LLPPFLFQFPGAFAPFFSPIGFLWCSYASYRITLVFLLPTSVAEEVERLINEQRKRQQQLEQASDTKQTSD
jgi:heme exporter protein D